MKSSLKTLVNDVLDPDKISKDEFARVFKESKALSKKQNREYMKVANKKILKQRLVQLYVCGFYSISQIASILLVSKSTVNKLLKEPDILEMVANYQDEEKNIIDTRIKSLRLKATETLGELLDSDDDSIRVQVAKDILDRTGHKAKEERDININVSYEQQLNQLIEGISVNAIEVDYESTNNEEGVDESD